MAVWAQTLSSAARNGADHLYGAAFVALGLAGVATLVAWTAVAARIARRIDLGRRLLVAEAGIAVVTTVAMAAMSVASLLWWQTVAGAAPGFFAGGRVSGPMAVAVTVMVAATLVGAAGSARALRELRRA